MLLLMMRLLKMLLSMLLLLRMAVLRMLLELPASHCQVVVTLWQLKRKVAVTEAQQQQTMTWLISTGVPGTTQRQWEGNRQS